MSKYVYPAVFTPEDTGEYSIRFPDLEGCYSCGTTLEESVAMAEDALCLFLYDKEENGEPIPEPSAPNKVECRESEFTSLIHCDTLSMR